MGRHHPERDFLDMALPSVSRLLYVIMFKAWMHGPRFTFFSLPCLVPKWEASQLGVCPITYIAGLDGIAIIRPLHPPHQ
eukprot:scaffold222371_cov37-Prasinocladus_malaysianus.AAC.1